MDTKLRGLCDGFCFTSSFYGLSVHFLNFGVVESHETLPATAGCACRPGPPGLRRQRSRPEHQRCVRLRGIQEQVTSITTDVTD